VFVIYAGLLTVGALILLLDLFAALGLAIALSRAGQLARRGTAVTGHVAAIRQRPGRRAGVTVAYETKEGKLETGGTSQRPRLGAPMTVRYDPSRPSRATTMLRPARTAAIAIPVTLVVAAVSAAMIVGSVFYFAHTHSGLQIPLAGGGGVLALALATAYYAGGQLAELLRWGRMVQASGKVKRFDEHAPGGPGILISFDSGDGRQEFWARAGSVLAKVGDTVTIHYDPAKPAGSATVSTAADLRAHAIAGTVIALVLFAGAVSLITLR
jgi:Protein of unknown function (DUF3592)